ncbi:hypothetical protein MMC29_004000 [Sticta canariensis]|nr:hypothetical protein [Sticta canariensis]
MPSPTKLSSLLEREESPPNGSPVHMDAIVSSPVAPPNTAIPPRTVQTTSSPIKTPETVSRIHPSHEEMHPSKAQHSIVKLARSESKSRLQMPEGWRARPEPGSSSTAIAQSTPTKTRGSLPAHMSSPRFDFTFSRPDAHLSIETQKIMESVREEATKIRAQMQAERNKQGPKDEEADHLHEVGGRRIATPRGKVGRYSDVHMQAFKKMDSIAGHASVWKTKIPPNAASLKPSHSKARLNAEEPKGRADRSIRSNEDDRLENTAPGKRARKNYGDDASSARPLSRGAASASESGHSDPSKPRTPPGRPSALTTPTKASLARSASVKQMKISMIPSLSRSQSTKTIRRSGTPKVEGGNRQLTPRSRFGHLKSILHRHQPKFSNDPAQVAAGTHLPAPEGGVTCDQEWPSLPSTPRAGLRTPAVNKRVDFTPGTKSKFDLAAASPSPSRIPGLHSHRSADPFASAPSLYPSLANSPTITTRTPKPSTPGDFTFRSDRILPLESTPFRAKNPTIRQVRPSGITTPMTAFENLPPIPHGISNKKRRRADSDDEDVENVPPAGEIEENDDGPRTKKLKSSPPKEGPAGAQRKTSKMGGSAIPKPTGARPGVMGVLSMSRLQMLARPKKRR